jgi:hypothetical protein
MKKRSVAVLHHRPERLNHTDVGAQCLRRIEQ